MYKNLYFPAHLPNSIAGNSLIMSIPHQKNFTKTNKKDILRVIITIYSQKQKGK